MSENVKRIGENDEFVFFVSEFMGNKVRIMQSKETGEVSLLADDVAKCIGYSNLQEMMSDDEVLDGYSQIIKENPNDALQPIELPDFVKGAKL